MVIGQKTQIHKRIKNKLHAQSEIMTTAFTMESPIDYCVNLNNNGASLIEIFAAAKRDKYWSLRLRKVVNFSIHLAVFVEPFLTYLLNGQKTIESRFSMVRCPPYNRVKRGDVLLIKQSGGPVLGICEIGETWSYELDTGSLSTIRKEFREAICAPEPEFWESKKNACYATLMRIEHVYTIAPVTWEKRDRRGWVIVKS